MNKKRAMHTVYVEMCKVHTYAGQGWNIDFHFVLRELILSF